MRAALAALLSLTVLAVATTRPAASAVPPGAPLPRTPLFDLTRQADLIVVARPAGGDTVRVIEVVAGREKPRTLRIVHFARLRRALNLPATKQLPAQSAKDFTSAVLFLRRFKDRWWIVEINPRACAANGCVWVRDGRVFWYDLNPWNNGPRLVERFPRDAKPAKALREKMALADLLKQIRSWWGDLERLREIDRMSSPTAQLRAMRAFIHPSTRPRHSAHARALVQKVYPEVWEKRYGPLREERPWRPPVSAWRYIRPGPSAYALRAIHQLESAKANERLRALRSLWYSATPEVIDAALEALKDQNEEIRLAAARALGDFADPSCTAPLIASFRSIKKRDDRVRRALLLALATTREPDAVAQLILALQQPDEPFRYDLVQILQWLSGYRPKNEQMRERLYSAVWWARWYEKRFKRRLELRRWDFAQLQQWLKTTPDRIRRMPTADFRMVSSEAIDEILRRCADLGFPNRARWCEILLRAWAAGAMNPEQRTRMLRAFGRAVIAGRKVYPLGSSALLRVVSGWPPGVSLPPSLKITSKSQVYLDGAPVGRAYPVRSPRLYVAPFRPADYGPGEHSFYITTEYTLKWGKETLTETVKTADFTFTVALPGQDIGIQAATNPELDSRVERAFQFIADQSVLGAATGPSEGKTAPEPAYTEQKGGNLRIEVYGRNAWRLAEPLPVDLAFNVEYEMLDSGLFLPGGTIYIPEGTTLSGQLDLYAMRYRLAAIQKPGLHRFRVHLVPSRDVALSHVDSRAYWDGNILVGPEMAIRVVERRSEKR